MTRTNDFRTDVNETADFCTLQVQTKRGDGTRDEDRIKATLRRGSLEEIEDERQRFLSTIEETIEEVRTYEADEDSDEDNE